MLHFARNWLAHLTDGGATNILIGVYEPLTAQTLLEWGTPCLNMTELVEIDPKGELPFKCAYWVSQISLPQNSQSQRSREIGMAF